MPINEGMMSSNKEDWATPAGFFGAVDDEFGFTLDACASDWNHKVDNYFTKEDDALTRSWAGHIVWMNPPYGREIGKWMKKAYEESRNAVVVCLVPARTDTAWWHDYAMQGDIRFLRGRIKFETEGGPMDAAPFPSALVIFGSEWL